MIQKHRPFGPYVAEIYGSSWNLGPTATFSRMKDAREWASSYGDTAQGCLVSDKKGRAVAHYRQTKGNWWRAEA